MSTHVKMTTIWCLHMFPRIAHSHMQTKYFNEWEFHHVNDIGKVLAPYAPSSITLKH
jgi:hypothetical protein